MYVKKRITIYHCKNKRDAAHHGPHYHHQREQVDAICEYPAVLVLVPSDSDTVLFVVYLQ